jgi:20S proteasome alpha/beta subunit
VLLLSDAGLRNADLAAVPEAAIAIAESDAASERKRMTAILGFTCTDGILLLADTEASFIHSGTKSECDKLQYRKANNGMMLCGAAGSGRDIDYATFQLESRMLQRTPTSGNELYVQIEELTRSIATSLNRYLDIDMLLAVRPYAFNNVSLYRWSSDLIYPITGHACSGSGMIQLEPLLRHVDFTGPSDTMLLYAVRLMLDAKRLVQGVGGKTEAAVLYHKEAGYRWFGSDLTQEIEHLVLDMERHNNLALMPCIAGESSDAAHIDQSLAAIGEDVKRFRTRYQELVRRSILQQPT